MSLVRRLVMILGIFLATGCSVLHSLAKAKLASVEMNPGAYAVGVFRVENEN